MKIGDRRTARIGVAPTAILDAKSRRVLGVRPRYVEALGQAGALVLLIASVVPDEAEAYLEDLDGLLLPGGGDVPPGLYGEAAEPGLDLLDEDIARTQIALAAAALAASLPVLGICLGSQVMNVACGGTLIQDLPRDLTPGGVKHSEAGVDARHEVKVAPGSRLFAVTHATGLDVVSQHHQAVRDLGRGLMASAFAPDNVIEAIEHEQAPFYLGVQWHPERNPESGGSRRLFAAFVEAARQRRAECAALKD